MNNTVTVALGLLLLKSAFGQSWVEERTFVSGGAATPRMDGLLTKPIKGQLGSFVWFQVQKDYSEAYTGAIYSPKSWAQFALGGGLEENKHPERIGSFVWVGDKRDSALFIAEYGGSGFWHKIEGLHSFNRFFDGGFIEERFKGSGAELKLKIPRTPLSMWGASMLSREPNTRKPRFNGLFGIRWTL